MVFEMVDGFDDRYFWDNDFNHGAIDDGWGLYEDVWVGDAQYYFTDLAANREVGRYGGWAAMLSDMDMASSYIYIGSAITPGKDWCGGIAINSGASDGEFLFCNSEAEPNRYGPIVSFDRSGEILVTRSKVGQSSTEVVARADASAIMTMWGWHYITFQFHVGDEYQQYQPEQNL